VSVGPEIIIPRPEHRGTKPYETPGEHWEEVCDKIYGSHELPVTIQHEHDAKWDTRFWSIQNVVDQDKGNTFGFWTVIGWLLFLSLCYPVYTIGFRYLHGIN
jgi:hypothetical protein